MKRFALFYIIPLLTSLACGETVLVTPFPEREEPVSPAGTTMCMFQIIGLREMYGSPKPVLEFG